MKRGGEGGFWGCFPEKGFSLFGEEGFHFHGFGEGKDEKA